MPYFVYIIECQNGSLYVGHTHDLAQRLSYHQRGLGAQHLVRYGFKQLVYQEVLPDKTAAIRREIQIKGWSRAKKWALTNGDFVLLKKRSQSRDK